MSSSPHSTIVPSDSDIKNTFSSTNILNYFSASPGSISPESSNDFTKFLLEILVFSPLHDDSKIEVIQACDTIPPPQVVIALPAILPSSSALSLSPMFDSQDLFPSKKISPKDVETPVESSIPVSPSSSVDLHHRLAPVMTQAAIRQLAANSIVTALEAQDANMENTNNTNRNTRTSRTPVARNGTNDHKQKSTDEDGDTRMDDSTGVSTSLGEIFLEGNKSWESNISDSDNTEDGGKIAGRAITTWGGGMVSYACMTCIFESSCKGEKTSMSKRYLVKSLEDSGEMLPGEAEK
nr:hypothetical protein [Tanacetum cinerariifolium]